jgi:predicted DNA-binding transcriptional regulator AlpA
MELNLAAKEDLEAHINSLGELAKVVNRGMCHLLSFELRIRSYMQELETAGLNVAVTDLGIPNDLLSVREVAQMLGVSAWALRNKRSGNYPEPYPHRGRSLLYRRADVEEWLSSRGP